MPGHYHFDPHPKIWDDSCHKHPCPQTRRIDVMLNELNSQGRTTGNPLLDEALKYVKRGWHVFPLPPGANKPYPGSDGFDDATTEERKIREFWIANPKANIGIVTGKGMFVLEADTDKWSDSVRALEGGPETLPETFTVQTPNGMHFYFKLPLGTYINTDRLGNGLNIIADGGYVV